MWSAMRTVEKRCEIKIAIWSCVTARTCSKICDLGLGVHRRRRLVEHQDVGARRA